MKSIFGTNRVIEPQHVLPTSAWMLDNARKIEPFEICVELTRIHVEGTSFKQICLEANDNDERIKQKIMDIVIRRGKLHNPVTDTGGLFCGKVAEIGSEYENAQNLKVGEEVICNASLTSVPLYIDKIKSIDRTFGQIEVAGYAIVHSMIPIINNISGYPMNLMLYSLNESGTLLRVSRTAVGKRKFLVVGNNLLTNILYGYSIRRVAMDDAQIICLLDKRSDPVLHGGSIDKLMSKIFNEVRTVDILKPLESLEELKKTMPFDLSVNCADIPGAETINILSTKKGGTVIFANLINNYNIALYITESISRQQEILCADGYVEPYDKFDKELVMEIAPYIEDAVEGSNKVKDDPAYPISRKDRLQTVSGQKNNVMEDFVCGSRAMTNVLDEMITVSKYDCNVLITGETGVGKEKVANIIDKNSSRKLQPFIKVNCASVSPSLIESEFFGCEEGVLGDDQIKGRKGYFELADNGVIFLDDVGELSPEMQAKLLRAIQDGEFFRVGGSRPVKTNVRIISATNRNIEQMIEEGKFRRDLYYRLNVVSIRVPALRERTGDIPPLINYIIEKYGEKFDMKRTIDRDAVEYLKEQEWRGNIRELENTVQRLMINANNEQITLLDVMRELNGDIFSTSAFDADSEKTDDRVINLSNMVNDFERSIIKHAAEEYGSTRKIAKALGISQTQLVRKKKKYGI